MKIETKQITVIKIEAQLIFRTFTAAVLDCISDDPTAYTFDGFQLETVRKMLTKDASLHEVKEFFSAGWTMMALPGVAFDVVENIKDDTLLELVITDNDGNTLYSLKGSDLVY